MRYLAALALIASASPALASWDVSRVVDPMTDKTVAVATLAPLAGSGNATLRVNCSAHVGPELVFPVSAPWRTVGVTFRFDDGPSVPRIAVLSDDRTTAYPWLNDSAGAMQSLRTSKRLRITAAGIFFDFNLTGAEAVCR